MGKPFLRNTLPSDLEAIAAILSGAALEPLSGLAGIAGSVLPGEQGQGANWVKNVQGLGYTPNNPESLQQISSALAIPMEMYEKGTNWLGDTTMDITGSPTAASAMKSLPEIAGAAFGLKHMMKGKQMPSFEDGAQVDGAGRRKFMGQAGGLLGAAALGAMTPGSGIKSLLDTGKATIAKAIPKVSPSVYQNVQILKTLVQGMDKIDAHKMLDDFKTKGVDKVFEYEPFKHENMDGPFKGMDMDYLVELAKKDKVHIDEASMSARQFDNETKQNPLSDNMSWDEYKPYQIPSAMDDLLMHGIRTGSIKPSSFKADLEKHIKGIQTGKYNYLGEAELKHLDSIQKSKDPVGELFMRTAVDDADITGKLGIQIGDML